MHGLKRSLLIGAVLFTAAVTGGFLAVRSVMGQAPPGEGKVVTAESIRLVDKTGKLRAELGVFEDGKTGLDLFDKEGKVRLKLIVTDAGTPSLGFYTKDGKIYSSCSCLWK